MDCDGNHRDVRFQLDRFPFTAPGLICNASVYPLVKELLRGGDVNLLHSGVMWALLSDEKKPGEPQNWHGDGGHLFAHTICRRIASTYSSVKRRIVHLESRREKLRASTLSLLPPFSWHTSKALHHHHQIKAFLRGLEELNTLVVG